MGRNILKKEVANILKLRLEGHSYEDIALKSGLAIGTVHKYVRQELSEQQVIDHEQEYRQTMLDIRKSILDRFKNEVDDYVFICSECQKLVPQTIDLAKSFETIDRGLDRLHKQNVDKYHISADQLRQRDHSLVTVVHAALDKLLDHGVNKQLVNAVKQDIVEGVKAASDNPR